MKNAKAKTRNCSKENAHSAHTHHKTLVHHNLSTVDFDFRFLFGCGGFLNRSFFDLDQFDFVDPLRRFHFGHIGRSE